MRILVLAVVILVPCCTRVALLAIGTVLYKIITILRFRKDHSYIDSTFLSSVTVNLNSDATRNNKYLFILMVT